MSVFKYLGFSLCFVFVSNAAVAEESTKESSRLLAKYDANGDQVISLREVEDKRKRVFTHMDSDQDGDVSFAEYENVDKAKRAPLLKARFQMLDLNRDGRLTGEEYASYLGSFDRLDQNKDGRLSGQEMQKAPKSIEQKNDAEHCLLWFCVRKNAF